MFRPLAWSANSTITAAIATSVAAVIEHPNRAHTPRSTAALAHPRRPASQAAPVVHIGVAADVAPARSTHPRRRAAARPRRSDSPPWRTTGAPRHNPDRRAALAFRWSTDTRNPCALTWALYVCD
ncbi:hypothetical protein [Mycolicibacterium sp. 120270]|uniref:hypothetical protein n=1 Tax=Mycolicibacterium sp. 120270 TaxID=3090600 RepID=UPI00299F4E64|nr:hypothetical protein [Mycolicibacterium sp. 120270]MDX1887907.1 hypothetical protein [Mycolicibacterium sp. 120270]